ncbi:hypothetical protein D3C71_1188600 [compost metagenome]
MALVWRASASAAGNALAAVSVVSTPRPPALIPARARISDAFPRMAAGLRVRICWQKRVRNASAPTATGSRVQGFPAATALSIARRMACARGEVSVPTLINNASASAANCSASSASITIAGDAPSASKTLAVKVCTTSLVMQWVSGERVRK